MVRVEFTRKHNHNGVTFEAGDRANFDDETATALVTLRAVQLVERVDATSRDIARHRAITPNMATPAAEEPQEAPEEQEAEEVTVRDRHITTSDEFKIGDDQA